MDVHPDIEELFDKYKETAEERRGESISDDTFLMDLLGHAADTERFGPIDLEYDAD